MLAKLQEWFENPCFKSLNNSIILWTDHIAVAFLCLLARRGRCETDNHVPFEQNVSALKHVLIYSSLCLEAGNTSTPYNLVGKAHYTGFCFSGSAIYWELSLRELRTTAPRHALKLTGTVSKYVPATRPEWVGGIFLEKKKKKKVSKLTNNQDNKYLNYFTMRVIIRWCKWTIVLLYKWMFLLHAHKF